MAQDLDSLLHQHDELEELFLCHQEALLAQQPRLALLFLQVYGELLAVHMEFEDHVLLPRYAQSGPAERAPVVLYSGQHRKLSMLLSASRTLTLQLVEGVERPRRHVLRTLDLESTLKHLCEHHHVAESTWLFPRLETVLVAAEREVLTQRGWAVWNAKRRELTDSSSAARAELAVL